jgi:hypothetical protein
MHAARGSIEVQRAMRRSPLPPWFPIPLSLPGNALPDPLTRAP